MKLKDRLLSEGMRLAADPRVAKLAQDERFFSIDEYGPFAVKPKPGRVLAGPGENPSVPQWQKSKGWLIATAALELSRYRVTHFYSRAKNTPR